MKTGKISKGKSAGWSILVFTIITVEYYASGDSIQNYWDEQQGKIQGALQNYRYYRLSDRAKRKALVKKLNDEILPQVAKLKPESRRNLNLDEASSKRNKWREESRLSEMFTESDEI